MGSITFQQQQQQSRRQVGLAGSHMPMPHAVIANVLKQERHASVSAGHKSNASWQPPAAWLLQCRYIACRGRTLVLVLHASAKRVVLL
jgi:hypothetical protein